jgi:hypothetical protein
LSFRLARNALMDTDRTSAGIASSPDPGTIFRLCEVPKE